ncbi:MAG: galactokinase [bacterium]|nr:galactokinase [bacterium]
MSSPIILSRTPYRIPLGGGSTDMPSYYREYGGFIFGAAINLYMDILVKQPRSDDLIHVHYKSFEAVDDVAAIRHDIARQALIMNGITDSVAISFKADTPAGTGLGSSGACAVGLMKALSLFDGRDLSGLEAAEMSFDLTQALGLPDGKQDPYLCALGDFTALYIDTDGKVTVSTPAISEETKKHFWDNSSFFYTGVHRHSKPILSAQSERRVIEVKHEIRAIGEEVLGAFVNGDLDRFGRLLDRHWQVKRGMVSGVSNDDFDDIYRAAKSAGALGGKIMGAGGGGYFMFYCPDADSVEQVRFAMSSLNMREMIFSVDKQGCRAKVIDI